MFEKVDLLHPVQLLIVPSSCVRLIHKSLLANLKLRTLFFLYSVFYIVDLKI